MKKLGKALFVLMSAAFALPIAACGGTPEGSGKVDLSISIESIQEKYDASLYQYEGEPVTLTMSHWDSGGATVERAVLNTLLDAFHRRYPTINVQADIISDYETTYATNIATNNLHDVFMVSDGVFANWSTGGKMVNLNPYIDSSDLVDPDSIVPSALTRYRYDAATGLTGEGAQLVMPRDISAHVLYYNKDYFKSKGVALPPSDRIMTMEEAVTMWQQLTERDGDGDIEVYGVAGLAANMEGLVWSAGGDFLNPQRNGFPTDDASLNAIKRAYGFAQDAYFKYEIMPPGGFNAGMDEATLFAQQKVATCIAGSWNVTIFRSLSFDWDIAYVPSFEVAPEKNAWSGSCGYAISTSCANKEAAWKLVEYVGSEEGQEILSATGIQFPIYYETLGLSEQYLSRESALKPEHYEIFLRSISVQPAGLWTYTKSQQWKEQGYDRYSEYLLDENASRRWSVDKFVEEVRKNVNSCLA